MAKIDEMNHRKGGKMKKDWTWYTGVLEYYTCSSKSNTLLYSDYIIFFRFYCKNNGVLYENDTIQIGIKTECRANLARMALFYGNKTSFPFIVSA